ncbi:hypothetical protein FQN57_001168 [Myotisia sp. PD_48]|nr:hypothetical protein FQN57_001168 [Myotisia sp. PD_48]
MQPRLPLTPASSTDIAAMEKGCGLPLEEMVFSLPPAALSTPSFPRSDIRSPTSPESPPLDCSRGLRQKAGSKRTAVEFCLPPPPTRTRKIIQVKPKSRDQSIRMPAQASPQKRKSTDLDDSSHPQSPAGSSLPKKRQANSGTTSAGRKIARKTAHSLIERRRRSKMNQEFATLKDMIPACRGHEMHKLAILQASIEYLQYLETCVKDLKAANAGRTSTPTSPKWHPSVSAATEHYDSGASLQSSPEIPPFSSMSSAITSPVDDAKRPLSQFHFEIPPMSLPLPAIPPPPVFSTCQDDKPPPDISRPLVDPTTASPNIISQHHLSSPIGSAVNPDVDMDREATTALLMLNKDRRSPQSIFGRFTWPKLPDNSSKADKKLGISVHDLLSH